MLIISFILIRVYNVFGAYKMNSKKNVLKKEKIFNRTVFRNFGRKRDKAKFHYLLH